MSSATQLRRGDTARYEISPPMVGGSPGITIEPEPTEPHTQVDVSFAFLESGRTWLPGSRVNEKVLGRDVCTIGRTTIVFGLWPHPVHEGRKQYRLRAGEWGPCIPLMIEC